MIFKDKLYNEITKQQKQTFSIKEIENRFNIRKGSEKKMMEKAISSLIEEGKMVACGKGKISVASPNEFIKGKLQGNRKGFAFLIREDDGDDIFIPNRNLAGALHNDTVYAQKTGESEGKVISIVERGTTKLIGTLIRSSRYFFVVPDDDKNFKDIFIPEGNIKGARLNDKVLISVAIDNSTKKPFGKVERIIGKAGERNTDVLSILLNYGFSEKFPQNVLQAADKISYKEDKDRKDFRSLLTITIDGEDAKDFDDAISLEKIGDIFRLYVHIADVSHYVNFGSAIDKEAIERTTSVYFPGSVFPMLPEAISNGVCSLRPEEEKLTMTVVMDINKNGEVIKEKFYNSITKSNYRMTYNQVTRIIKRNEEKRSNYSEILEMIENSKELAGILANKREAIGAINFETQEAKILLDENGDVKSITPYPYDISNSIIEQFMVLANETVAKFISEKGFPCVYRVHESPNEEKLANFIQFLNGLGYKLDLSKGVVPKIFSDLLGEIKGENVERIINKVMLRSMQKAQYTTQNLGHFGLGLEYYCHFTSPIRRYPDLMVHRVLKTIIAKNMDQNYLSILNNLCQTAAEKSTEREISAERAERDIDDYYKALFMGKNIGKKFVGIVSGIINRGIFVELDNTVEGFVSLDDLPSDRYQLDDKNFRLIGTKFMFALGDEVEVEVLKADIISRNVDFHLLSEPETHLRKKQLSL